jgi:hypothetical protein
VAKWFSPVGSKSPDSGSNDSMRESFRSKVPESKSSSNKREEIVIDGAQFPKELEFSGPKKED